MPTYEYRCNDCGHEFERVEHLGEHEGKHECPTPKHRACNGGVLRQDFAQELMRAG